MAKPKKFGGESVMMWCRIPQEAADKMKEMAERRWLTLSDIVREAIKQYLERDAR